jgi:hypothetical protein
MNADAQLHHNTLTWTYLPFSARTPGSAALDHRHESARVVRYLVKKTYRSAL